MTAPDTTLREALTGFTEGLETGKYGDVAKVLRSMLAAHPLTRAPETEDYHGWQCSGPTGCEFHAPVSDIRREAATVSGPRHCGAENADYPGEYACTFPAGHPRVPDPDDGPTMYDHAAPASGAWWNMPAPMSDTRREDVARALFEHDQKAWPDSVSTWENIHQAERDAYLARADAVLAVLPAPPVVDADVTVSRPAHDWKDATDDQPRGGRDREHVAWTRTRLENR